MLTKIETNNRYVTFSGESNGPLLVYIFHNLGGKLGLSYDASYASDFVAEEYIVNGTNYSVSDDFKGILEAAKPSDQLGSSIQRYIDRVQRLLPSVVFEAYAFHVIGEEIKIHVAFCESKDHQEDNRRARTAFKVISLGDLKSETSTYELAKEISAIY